MELKAEVNVFELDTLWEQRQEALAQEEKSLKEYENLDPEYREALGDLLDQALTKMQEDKTWLPYSMEVIEGSAIDVKVRILFSDITQEIVRRRDQERRQIRDAAKSTDEMVRELEEVRRLEDEAEDQISEWDKDPDTVTVRVDDDGSAGGGSGGGTGG